MNVDKVYYESDIHKIPAWVEPGPLSVAVDVYLHVANPISGIWVDLWHTQNKVMM